MKQSILNPATLIESFWRLLAVSSGILSMIGAEDLRLVKEDTSVSAFRAGEEKPLLTQHAQPDFRPYLHPLVAPDGKGVLTEFSPGHHRHQTVLYWGFTRLNGRDFFHHPGGDYWRRRSFDILVGEGEKVSWQTTYDLLDEDGAVVGICSSIVGREFHGVALAIPAATARAIADRLVAAGNRGAQADQ